MLMIAFFFCLFIHELTKEPDFCFMIVTAGIRGEIISPSTTNNIAWFNQKIFPFCFGLMEHNSKHWCMLLLGIVPWPCWFSTHVIYLWRVQKQGLSLFPFGDEEADRRGEITCLKSHRDWTLKSVILTSILWGCGKDGSVRRLTVVRCLLTYSSMYNVI